MRAWYFSEANCRLRHGDNRIIKAGVTHKVDCDLVLCESGLHGSVSIMDALGYAPGPYIWRVELGGEIVRGDDKAVASERIYLWGYDATDVLWKTARLAALDVTHLWNAPDVVVQFLKTGDENLRDAARAGTRVAWDARDTRDTRDAQAAAWAVQAAAWAVWAAAWAAAWAVQATAWDAANAASLAAARAAALETQSRRLYRLIMDNRP